MALDSGEFRLSCELRGHEDDVRGICICGDVGIATSSRDRTVRFWAPDPDKKNGYVLSKTLAGHSSFVGPLVWLPPSDRFPEGAIASGGMDTLVLLSDLRTGQVVETMRGHQYQVTGLALDDNGDIISSSMDCTIRRWRKGQAVEFWEAHQVAVQAVIKLPSGEFVTGSSDSTMKLWKGRTCLHTFVGHADTVRGLALLPGVGILSASHDCSIKLWTLTGQILMEMMGHTSLVYSVAAHSSGLVASGSEDCFLKIWRDGVCVQSIEHPACVWDVKFLENGDVVTACSDGAVRIWTSHGDRISDPHALEAYAVELSQYKNSRKKVGGLKLMDLPGLEALQVPGTINGQTIVIREGDNGVAYSWNSQELKWEKIGEVVDGPGDTGNGQVSDGVRYDYVFDVDIGDGEPIRKLPYNLSDNPYAVADKWLLKENLPLSYRQQVVEFILQNTGQRNSVPDPSLRDPFTGSSAYIPGEPSFSTVSAPKPTFKHIPKKGMLLFDSAQFDGILKKISEFNTKLQSNMEQKPLSLSELELSRLAAIVQVLKDTSHYHSSSFADADITLLFNLLKSWPLAMMFPVIDTLRMFILHPDGASLLLKHIESGNDVLMETFKKAMMSPVQPANILTIIRAVTNLFRHSFFFPWLQSHCSEILDGLSNCVPTFNKNAHLSYATLILNYSVLLSELKDKDGQAQVLSAALEIAEDANQDADSRFRALVAIGSLMLVGLMKPIAIDFDVQSIAKAAKGSKESKIAEVGADIELILKAT
ncbi:phospholipase A-2-activating protein isoform X1 [Ananas comosus]|uniref:Phospholipase A-2-activating protein isoform X1 n=1 Tax=Ananas comosus TaxID=4615 RepID=A0A6P5FJM5_ANACO|nr:phospholipase A-2-activating protein isoform X1 [Ananas comosus]